MSWGQTVGGGVIQRWWWPRMTLRLEGGCVVGQTVGGGVIHRWWWPKMTLRLAFQAREGVVESNSDAPPSCVSSKGGGGGSNSGWCGQK